MPSKNDLSALKKSTDKPAILPEEVKPMQKAAVKPAPANQSKGVGGRPAKPKDEKRSYKVVLSLTETEGQELSQQAGLAGDATFLYAKLKDLGVI